MFRKNCRIYIYIYIYIYCKLKYHYQKIRRTPTHEIREHWASVSTLLGLISSVYRNLHHWRSNQRPQIAVPKLYDWATSSYRTQVTSNQLVMVIARPTNPNVQVTSVLFPREKFTPQGHVFPRSLEIRIRVIIIPQGQGNRCRYFYFLSREIYVHWYIETLVNMAEINISLYINHSVVVYSIKHIYFSYSYLVSYHHLMHDIYICVCVCVCGIVLLHITGVVTVSGLEAMTTQGC